MVSLRIEVAGEVQLHRAITRFTAGVSDLSPLWPDVLTEFRSIEAEQFDTRGHGEWAPLSPTYASWKARNYPGRSLLVREGELRDSLTSDKGADVKMAPLELRIGTRVKHAGFHQLGTSRMPARKPIDLREPDKQRLMRVVQRYLVNLSREADGAPGRGPRHG